MREQGESPLLTRGGRWPEDPFFDFSFKDRRHRGFGPGWMHTGITDLYRDINSVFVGARENAADRVLRSSKFEQDAEGGVRDQYR
jgi:hypothetical protein